jgi:glyoxylase-like metal-dependent hydrolase (beta-lactamase superfamily II)
MTIPVAQDWYEVLHLSEGVSLIRERHVASWLRCNIWHVRGRDRDLIIDTGLGLRPLTQAVASLSERPVTAIMTHSHFDHAGGMHQFCDRCGHPAEAAIIAEPNHANTVADTGYLRADTFTALPYAGFSHQTYGVCPAPLTRHLDEGDVIDLGDRVFQVFHLPGHSPGSIALFETATGTLFSGDVIYDGALIDNLYHSEAEVLLDSHARLRELAVSTVHAGHFGSFNRERMIALLDTYQAGGLRIENATSWIAEETEGHTLDE